MVFRFKRFALNHDRSTMKIGTDAVLLAALTDVGEARAVLDMGCGCGVIAFCLAQQLSLKSVNARVCGIDIDAASIAEAQDNALIFNLLPTDNFCFEQISVQTFSQNITNEKRFDLIVSNPPFFNDDLKPTDSSRLRSKHSDGQLSFPELLDSVVRMLHSQGRFAIVLPKREGEEFDALASQQLHCVKRVAVQPTAKKPVHRLILEYSFDQNLPCREQHLLIRDADNQLTEDYRQLTEPYLL